MRDVLATASITLLGVIGAGCSADTADEAARHVGTYAATGEGGDGALLDGTVRLVDGCLIVEQDDLGERYLVYFPNDEVAWSHDGLDYADSTYGAGDAIALPGGVSADSRPVPSDCRERFAGLAQWIVAQSDEGTRSVRRPSRKSGSAVHRPDQRSWIGTSQGGG